MATLHRAHSQTRASPAFEDEHNYSAVMFETEDGRTTSKSSRMMKDPDTSSNENIRYQAMDMIKKDTRKSSASASRSNSLNTTSRRYYSSWDNLLERSEVRQSKTNLLASQNFGSTGSVNSGTSEAEKGLWLNIFSCISIFSSFCQIFCSELGGGGGHGRREGEQSGYQQAAGHHLQLHAVHNTSYQTNSTLETCLESDENDLEDLADVQLYDVPR